jgi:hypothetical protein
LGKYQKRCGYLRWRAWSPVHHSILNKILEPFLGKKLGVILEAMFGFYKFCQNREVSGGELAKTFAASDTLHKIINTKGDGCVLLRTVLGSIYHKGNMNA